MKKIIFIAVNILFSNYCICQNFLDKTVWINITPVEKNNISGKIINTMMFSEKDSVYIYTTTNVDSIVLYPINTASGTFNYGNKKTAKLSVVTNDEQIIYYDVKLTKKDKLLMTTPSGSIYVIYRKVTLNNNDNSKKSK